MHIVDKIIPVSIALTERSETVLPEVVNNDVNWGPTEVYLSKSWTRDLGAKCFVRVIEQCCFNSVSDWLF